MMTRGGEGVSIPPKNDDVIYEQPLTLAEIHPLEAFGTKLHIELQCTVLYSELCTALNTALGIAKDFVSNYCPTIQL